MDFRRSPDLIRGALEAAAEMVSGLPKELREVAFSKAFDALVGTGLPPVSHPPIHAMGGNTRIPEPAPASGSVDLGHIDRTKWHALSAKLTSTRSLALLALRALRDDVNIEWASVSTVRQVITERFRRSATEGAVRMALVRAGQFVDRRELDLLPHYRLMGPGDATLDKALSIPESASGAPKKATVRRKTAKGVTATTAVQQLIDSAFFRTKRRIGDIVEQLARRRALRFSSDEISVVMMRMVRKGLVERERDDDGVFCYFSRSEVSDVFSDEIMKRLQSNPP